MVGFPQVGKAIVGSARYGAELPVGRAVAVGAALFENGDLVLVVIITGRYVDLHVLAKVININTSRSVADKAVYIECIFRGSGLAYHDVVRIGIRIEGAGIRCPDTP